MTDTLCFYSNLLIDFASFCCIFLIQTTGAFKSVCYLNKLRSSSFYINSYYIILGRSLNVTALFV